MNYFKKGFSLIEVLIVLAILVILVAITLPSFQTMRSNQLLKATTAEVFSALNQARSNSISSIESKEYGVHFESDEIVIFEGTTYSSSSPSNRNISLTSPVSISNIALTSGATSLYFNRLSGEPSRTGTITISVSSLSKVITISATGTISTN